MRNALLWPVEVQKREQELLVRYAFRQDRYVSVHGGYTLALRRAAGQAGASAASYMATGGEVTDQKTMWDFEHKAATAKANWSGWRYEEAELSFQALADGDKGEEAQRKPSSFEVHCVLCDATQQEAIEKECVHVGLCTSAFVGQAHVLPEGDAALRAFLATNVVSTACATDCHKVKHPTGAETYRFASRKLKSIGCPTWLERADVHDASRRRV